MFFYCLFWFFLPQVSAAICTCFSFIHIDNFFAFLCFSSLSNFQFLSLIQDLSQRFLEFIALWFCLIYRWSLLISTLIPKKPPKPNAAQETKRLCKSSNLDTKKQYIKFLWHYCVYNFSPLKRQHEKQQLWRSNSHDAAIPGFLVQHHGPKCNQVTNQQSSTRPGPSIFGFHGLWENLWEKIGGFLCPDLVGLNLRQVSTNTQGSQNATNLDDIHLPWVPWNHVDDTKIITLLYMA